MQNINWVGFFDKLEGYGYFNVKLLNACLRRSPQITPMTFDQLDFWSSEHFKAAQIDLAAPTIIVGSPYMLENTKKLAGRRIVLTMYESTNPPERWSSALRDNSDFIIVPHQFLVPIIQETLDIERPVAVVPGGIDPDEFYPLTTYPQGERPYTFLALGDRGNRKGYDIAWAAFWSAFGEQNDVRLIIKAREYNLEWFANHLNDKRVTVWRSDVTNMREVYHHVDCMVFPSRGEGYGLPPREAAACGVPVIATRWGGLDDELDQWALPVKPIMIDSNLGGKSGSTRVEDVANQMRWCYENQQAARQRGLQASTWLHQNRTWQHAADTLFKVLEQIV